MLFALIAGRCLVRSSQLLCSPLTRKISVGPCRRRSRTRSTSWNRKKTVGKAKAKPAAAPSGPSNEEATIHVDDDVWSVPSDDEGQKSDKPAKASKSNTDKDAATAARKALREARELASSWRKEVNKAAKNMAALNNVCQSLNGTITRCNKSDGLFSDDQLESLGNALGKCTKFRQRSWARRTRNSCLRPNDLIIERCDRCQIRICQYLCFKLYFYTG